MKSKTSNELKKIISGAGVLSKKDFRSKMIKFQDQFANHEFSVIRKSFAEGDDLDTVGGGSLEHEFGDGTYIRKITMAKGTMHLSAIHLVTHPFFVMEGKATVISDEGVFEIEAPYHGMTKPGTQRILYIKETMVWITVHPTDKKDVEQVVDEVIAKDYNHPKLKLK
jgi:hypothetical protein